MSSGPEPSRAPRRPRGAFDLRQLPWTLLAFLGAGILLIDTLGAPIAYRTQIFGLAALGLGVIGRAAAYSWARRRPRH